jgi:sulfide:quinone oxidoreductase
MKRHRIVILGGSFGGLTVAHELRRSLSARAREIILISRDEHFVFIPSLPWVAVGKRKVPDISFDLARGLKGTGIEFVHAAATGIDATAQKVTLPDRIIDYDYLVIATGHRSANEAVPGLGPFDGPSHSIMSARETEEAHSAWKVFLESPGPMVIGCAPGASCLGPAYEFAFEVEHALRRRKLRHKVPITFVTPEPFLGHWGIGGAGRGRQVLEDAFDERGVKYVTSAAVSNIAADSVALNDGRAFPARYSMIIPALAGVDAVAKTPGLANPKGFVPVDEFYRHKQFQNIYAVGVAVALPPVEETPVPVNFPKTGMMTEQMAKVAALHIASTIEQKASPAPSYLSAACILTMGDTAAYMRAEPIRPPRNRMDMSA